MVTIVPSQVVDYVNTVFDLGTWFRGAELHLGNDTALAATVGLLDLVNNVPSHLITVDREDAARLISNVAAIKAAIYRAQNMEVRERQSGGVPTLKPIGATPENPVIVVRDVMAKCGDEALHPKTPELPFLADSDLRATLQVDISQAYAGLEDGHWKTTTVLGGSVLEALLLWLLVTRRDTAIQTAAAIHKLPSNPERWGLDDYIKVAFDANLIDEETRKQCELSKDFRNLIHPGRELRLHKKSTRGRALGTMSAVELLIEAIQKL